MRAGRYRREVMVKYSPSASQKVDGRRGERRRARAENRAVRAIRNHPEMGVRDGGVELERNRNGIKEVAVAEDDERARGDGRQQRRREVHVVVGGGEGSRLSEERLDLGFTVD